MIMKSACEPWTQKNQNLFAHAGDFNCDWFRQNDKIQKKTLVELTETLQLEQIINELTRITENSQTLIDLFFTN